MGYHWNWLVFTSPVPTGETTYLGWLFSGLRMTLALSTLSWALALALGIGMGILRTVPNRLLAGLGAAYVEIFRNVPLLAQLFIWYFVMPEILPFGQAFKELNPTLQQFVASTICLGLFTGARVCEQVRAGINALSRGQRSAALALGFTLPQAYRYVLVPVALRLVVPPLGSEMLNAFKNSAVCSTIGLLELAAQGRQLVDYTSQPYEAFIAVTAMYLVVNVVLMLSVRRLEKRTRVPGLIGARE
ncbi:MAG: amino acid ABC transporter permease [Myxococcales bacterium]